MKVSVFILIILFSSCSKHSYDRTKINLVIEEANSYKYDFNKEIFTTFYIDKPAADIKFKLSQREKEKITKRYYELDLDKLPKKITIEGSCNTMPLIFTVLHIQTKDSVQEISIDGGCKEFNFFNKHRAKRINSFLKYILEILNSRPQIKNSPKSNIPYM